MRFIIPECSKSIVIKSKISNLIFLICITWQHQNPNEVISHCENPSIMPLLSPLEIVFLVTFSFSSKTYGVFAEYHCHKFKSGKTSPTNVTDCSTVMLKHVFFKYTLIVVIFFNILLLISRTRKDILKYEPTQQCT